MAIICIMGCSIGLLFGAVFWNLGNALTISVGFIGFQIVLNFITNINSIETSKDFLVMFIKKLIILDYIKTVDIL